MTNPDNQGPFPEHGDQQAFEGDLARRDQIQRTIDEGREGELSEDDYQFAIEHSLIEG